MNTKQHYIIKKIHKLIVVSKKKREKIKKYQRIININNLSIYIPVRKLLII